MSLSSKLHDAEEYGRKAAHLGAERVRTGIQNVEANLRKLSSNRKIKNTRQSSSHADPEQEGERSPDPRVRTGIVSVNGRDVEQMRCTGGRRTN